ncbi:MAG: protein translocase subunit SecF [Sandaracinaceae bacterium]|jgi:preprotein translocase subunit SecF|nr:protein translocase subunit SecF [Sandaracinaceae bacterium]MBK8588697.1 protein translocase subunit SecF [Sandaracinaceae bacterium]MBP7683390.1 protein translocase subunit SecF [Deltaproteobacteria bacterium]
MELIKPDTYIDFMRYRLPVIGVSTTLVILSLASLFYPGANLGLDFSGGTELEVQFNGAVTTTELREALSEAGHPGADVVTVEGRANTYMLRVNETSAITEEVQAAIESRLTSALGDVTVLQYKVSPGGDKISLRLSGPADVAVIRGAIEGEGDNGVSVREVTRFGGTAEHRFEASLVGVGDAVFQDLQATFGERAPAAPLRIEWVGPKAGEQLRDAAIQSLLYAVAFIMVYVAFRFDLRFAPGAVLALFHDVVITVGIYVLVQKEMNLTTIAALLTILGYSINDTIVIFDRIRENMGRYKDKSLAELINISSSQVLSRTLMTSATTLVSVSAFFVFGTSVIQDLSFALFIGISVGTYSSIYVAAPMTEWIDRRFFAKAA